MVCTAAGAIPPPMGRLRMARTGAVNVPRKHRRFDSSPAHHAAVGESGRPRLVVSEDITGSNPVGGAIAV